MKQKFILLYSIPLHSIFNQFHFIPSLSINPSIALKKANQIVFTRKNMQQNIKYWFHYVAIRNCNVIPN